jgi:hypothetical protein
MRQKQYAFHSGLHFISRHIPKRTSQMVKSGMADSALCVKESSDLRPPISGNGSDEQAAHSLHETFETHCLAKNSIILLIRITKI